MGKSLVSLSDPVRAMAVASQNALMDQVTRFGQYVDVTGAKATSEKGLVVTINRYIKKYYGCAVDEMSRDMLLHSSSAKDRIVSFMAIGIEKGTTRREIKDGIHSIIRAYGESYHALENADVLH